MMSAPKTRQVAPWMNRKGGPSRVTHPSMVYFIIRGEHIKIGRTTNLPVRVNHLQQLMSDVLGVVPGGAEVETSWHKRFAHLRDSSVYGGKEWFRATDELLDAIADEAVSSRADWDTRVPVPA